MAGLNRLAEDDLDPSAELLHIFAMNHDNQTSPTNKPRLPIFHYLTMAAALIGVFLLWRQQDNSQKQIKALVLQNASLQQKLKKSQVHIADLTSGEPSANAMKQKLAARAATRKPVVPEEKETLTLQPPTVMQTDAGLAVHFAFKPTEGAELPSRITLVVRVPGTTDAKITSLKPTAKSNEPNVECVVNASGKLAMIEGAPSDLKSLSFELVVSAPVKAMVRGSKGIKDFELNIAPDGCSVQPL